MSDDFERHRTCSSTTLRTNAKSQGKTYHLADDTLRASESDDLREELPVCKYLLHPISTLNHLSYRMIFPTLPLESERSRKETLFLCFLSTLSFHNPVASNVCVMLAYSTIDLKKIRERAFCQLCNSVP